METPHWERGYRCHGYWLGLARVGFVGLPPGKAGAAGYSWSCDYPREGRFRGWSPTLGAARRAVEAAYERATAPA